MEVGGRLNLKGQLLEMLIDYKKEILTKHLHLCASSCAYEAYSSVGSVTGQYDTIVFTK
jgi:hypothetical protein